jgi:predicted RNA-binding Zn ribbon-like protein
MADHYVLVDGLRLPAKLSGHPALDFCNTLAGWDGNEPWDYLQSYEHLAAWAGFAELLPGERIAGLRRRARERGNAATATAALEQARAFRGRLYDVLQSGPSAESFASVADKVNAAAARLRLRRRDDAIDWEIDPQAGLGAPIDAVAWSAGELLTSGEISLVRACPGHACGWLFLDRRGRRRWCTMTTCGNREKVRRFAARQRGAG